MSTGLLRYALHSPVHCLAGTYVVSGCPGDQCQDSAGSSSSDTLAIALGVALPAAFLLLCCLVALFALFGYLYWRKGRKQELLLAAEWSDSGESVEMSDFSSYASCPSLNRSFCQADCCLIYVPLTWCTRTDAAQAHRGAAELE
jgi:hypothetical protein